MRKPSWLDTDRYPFDPNWLPLGSGRIHYVDEGEGRPVVMVHGNPTWSFLYRDLIKSLSSAHRCMAPDHLGFGLSDKPSAWSYLPADHARNLAALVRHLQLEDIILVVQDWGGPIGLSYAVEHPDNVSALIILNTWMWPLGTMSKFGLFSRVMGSPAGRLLAERMNFMVRGVMPLWFADRGKLTPSLLRHYLRPLDRPEKRKGTWVFPREILGSKEWLERLWQRRCRLESIPKLMIWGMRDMAFGTGELNRWKEAFPGGELARIRGAGHFVQEEAPAELVRVVKEFLAELD